MDVSIKLIRSLIISSPDGLLIEDIDKLYKEDVGESVPFRKFGFDTLAEFLRSSGQFVPKKTQYGTRVIAKTTDASAHIVEMRKNQTVSKAERKRKNRATKSPKFKIGVIRSQPKSSSSKMTLRRKSNKGGSTQFMVVKQSEFPKDVREISAKPVFSTFNVSEVPIVSTNDAAAHSAKVTSNSKSKTNLYARLAPKQPFEESKENNSSKSVFSTANSIFKKTQKNGYPKRRGLHVRFEIQQPFSTQEFATRFDERPALVPTPLCVPSSSSVERLSPKILHSYKTNELNGATSTINTSPRAPLTTPVLNKETNKQAENFIQLNEVTDLNPPLSARFEFLKRFQKQEQQLIEDSQKCEKPCLNSNDMVQKITEAKVEQRSQPSPSLQARHTEMEFITQKLTDTLIDQTDSILKIGKASKPDLYARLAKKNTTQWI